MTRLSARDRRALLIGLAHELQHSADVPHRHWDVPLDAVITERAASGFTIRGRRFMAARIALMAVRKIIRMGHPTLRKVARELTRANSRVRRPAA